MRAAFVMVLLAGLAGCGDPAPTGNASGPTAATAGLGSGLGGPGWKADDACRALDKATVAAAVGTEVTEVKLDGVSAMTDSMAAVSSCYYTLKSGGTVAVLTRQSPPGFDTTAESMKDMRDQVAGMMGPIESVSGVGRDAFWIVKLRQLNVFVGNDRYFNVTVPAELGGKDPKTIALALATRLT